jgi:hypothetical protein
MIEIVKVANYEERKARHEMLMETNPDYKQATESLSFSQGKKLSLSIEVTDEFFSQNIINLLHGKLPGMELLGFKVTEVCFSPDGKTRQDVINELKKMIHELETRPYS